MPGSRRGCNAADARNLRGAPAATAIESGRARNEARARPCVAAPPQSQPQARRAAPVERAADIPWVACWTHRGTMRPAKAPPNRRRGKGKPTIFSGFLLSPLPDSNRRPLPYHGSALPTELRGRFAGSSPLLRPHSERVFRVAATETTRSDEVPALRRVAPGCSRPPPGARSSAITPGRTARHDGSVTIHAKCPRAFGTAVASGCFVGAHVACAALGTGHAALIARGAVRGDGGAAGTPGRACCRPRCCCALPRSSRCC